MKRGALLALVLFFTSLSPLFSKDTSVQLGIDVLEAQHFAPLQGKQVGLITNQTGRDSKGRSTADVLFKAPGVKLLALFSPEHGIRGLIEHGQQVQSGLDPKTHLPVYSLYGATQKPTMEMLNAIDVIVFDMQDVGARFYTYLTTLAMAMEAVGNRKIEFMVLDRPNPAGGEVVEGQVLNPKFRHFTAYFEVPVRHGLTAGEMASWYNQTANVHANVIVIPMLGWKREMLWDKTDLPFTPPSPNIQTPRQALLYSGIGMFEATNIAVGRGTETPFELIGAPWIDSKALLAALESANLPGITFKKVTFTPSKDLYSGQMCQGVRFKLSRKLEEVRPVDLFVHLACALRHLYPDQFQPRWDEMARVTGSKDFEDMYKAGKTPDEIIAVFHKSADAFIKDRAKYLLY